MPKTGSYTTGELARIANVHQQTIIRWAVDGILKPKRRGKTGQRRYSDTDAIAAIIAKEAMERRIATEAVKEIVRAVQDGEEGDSEIIMLEGRIPGMVINAWLPDPSAPEAIAELDRWERDGHPVLLRTRLRDIVKRFREQLADG